MDSDPLQARLQKWLMRRTATSAVRRVGELPLGIVSESGLVREENQDRVAVLRVQTSRSTSFIVGALCDGMGGMTDGARCAAIALSTFLVSCLRMRDVPAAHRLKSATLAANGAVFKAFRGRGGATLSAILFDSAGANVGVNVGDSRIYALSKEDIRQLTVDDTLSGQLRNQDSVRDDHLRFNDLLQFVGIGGALEPHIITLPQDATVSLLLTSDGIHFVGSRSLHTITMNAEEPALAARRLAELSKWCGGHDNASAIAVGPSIRSEWSRSDLNGSTIEVWDPFGDLQIIGIDRDALDGVREHPAPHVVAAPAANAPGAASRNASASISKEQPKTAASNLGRSSPSKSAQTKQKRRRRGGKRKPLQQKTPIEDQLAENIEKPQLKIGFGEAGGRNEEETS